MLKAEPLSLHTPTPVRISSIIAEAGTAASMPESVLNDSVSFAYYFVSDEPQPNFIAAEDYPVLAEMWANDADAIYDDL